MPVVIAFVVKAIVLFQLRDHPLTQPDSGLDTTAYVELAKQVAAGNIGLGPWVYYVSPLYIYVLAAGFALFGSFFAVRVAQIVLGAIAVGFIFLTTREWFGERAAWLAAGLAILTGLFTFYEVLILQASIDAFLTAAALYAVTRRRYGLAGLVFGIQTLNRPNILIAALGMALVLVLASRRIRPAALLVAGVIVGISPAAIRNAVVAHQWSFVSSHGGLNFYIGNNEAATGFYHPVPGITPAIVGQEKDARRVAEQALGHPVSDAEASDYFFRLSRTWIVAHPGDAFLLFVRKFYDVFNAAHVPLPHSFPFYAHDARTLLRFLVVGPWLLIPLGLVGLAVARIRRSAPTRQPASTPVGVRPRPRGRGSISLNRVDEAQDSARDHAYLVFLSFVPAYAIAVALFFVAERYRLPLLVPLCVGAGAAIDLGWRAASERTLSSLARPAFLLAVLAVAANWPLHLNDGRWHEGLRMAEQLVIHQRYDEADAWAERLDARGDRPSGGAAHYGVAAQLLTVNQADRALVDFRKGLDLSPGDARLEYGLGEALLKLGRPGEAIPHLQRGFDAGIEIPLGGYDLAVAQEAAGDLPGAARTIARINPADTTDVEPWLKLGRIAAQARAPDVAERFFRHAARRRPDLASARQQYGLNLLVLGRAEEGARELGEAVRLDPKNSDSLSGLAVCELQLGRTADARAHAAAALAINPDDQLARGILRGGGT